MSYSHEARLSARGSKTGAEIPVALSFDIDDPWAVTLTFYPDVDAVRTAWVFSRELLAAGVIRPSGEGDIRLRPSPRYVVVYLNGESSREVTEHLFIFNRKLVCDFLDATMRQLPLGTEYEVLDDCEAELQAILEASA